MFKIAIDGIEYASGVTDYTMLFLLHHLPVEFPKANLSWSDDESCADVSTAPMEEVA